MLKIKNIPLIFLLTMSCFWAYFYQSSNILNAYGTETSEWLLFIDGILVLPFLCFVCVKDKKEAAIKALAYACLVILLGSYIIPEHSKLIWPYFESGRYLVLALFVVLEVTTIFTVLFAIKASLTQDKDPDLAILQPIENIIGKGIVSKFLAFEARVWTYALFSRKVNQENFNGEQHFSCHMKDGAQSNQLGFIFVILIELPVMHLLLHYLWSPSAANITTLLTIVGLVFFIAEFRALSIRPISLSENGIIIRYGLFNPLSISFSEIASCQLNNQFVARSNNVKRFNLSGYPNIEITLHSGKLIYLGLDSPKEFILMLEDKLL